MPLPALIFGVWFGFLFGLVTGMYCAVRFKMKMGNGLARLSKQNPKLKQR